MNKIRLKIDKATWQLITGLILQNPNFCSGNTDKYNRAMCSTLLQQVYIKFHNKLHSLGKINNISFTYAEAAALAVFLNKSTSYNAAIIDIVRIIDQKLT